MRRHLLCATALVVATAHPALAQTARPSASDAGPAGSSGQQPPDTAADARPQSGKAPAGDIVVTARTSRSVAMLSGQEMQRQLPGINPLKAIETLPGVTFMTADPWGNTEQNISLFIHGFNQQQLGYTLDGIPLGDQQYGNYNGLSPQRAVISENVGRVTLASGAGDLGTPSTSNLGGTIDTFTSNPHERRGGSLGATVGSRAAIRLYGRIDSGDLGDGTRLFVSGAHLKAKAWDYDAWQGGDQINAKLTRAGTAGTLTSYLAWSSKIETYEDSTTIKVVPATPTSAAIDNRAVAPYTRSLFYPDIAAARRYYASPAFVADRDATGSNYRDYYVRGDRRDWLGYTRYDWQVARGVTWSNTGYFHHDDGVGVIAGPIAGPGIPGLLSYYFPGAAGTAPTSADNLARLSILAGRSGLIQRTSEYRVDRYGMLSTITADWGDHSVTAGLWYEHQRSSSIRRWYGFAVDTPPTPYARPLSYEPPLITQMYSRVQVDEWQGHVADAWHVTPQLVVEYGAKTTLQHAVQTMPVQPIPGSMPAVLALPEGTVTTGKPFLPQIGARWDAGADMQLFVNAQQNVRQFQTTAAVTGAAAGTSPFALGSQRLFDRFKRDTRPETSWTYEAGVRTRHRIGGRIGFEGQASVYHVDFSNRLLGINPLPTTGATVGGGTILQNVGSVHTNGIDLAGTLTFGRQVSLYNALSYNSSAYGNDYQSGTAIVPTRGKQVPGSPDWLNKTVFAIRGAGGDLQLTGDYIGRRYATYTNDLSVRPYWLVSLHAGIDIATAQGAGGRHANLGVNVTNLTNCRAESTLSVGNPAFVYGFFPLAPRQAFLTLTAGF